MEHGATSECLIASLGITLLLSNQYCTFAEVIKSDPRLYASIAHGSIYFTLIPLGKPLHFYNQMFVGRSSQMDVMFTWDNTIPALT